MDMGFEGTRWMARGADTSSRRAAGERAAPIDEGEAVRRAASLGDAAELARLSASGNVAEPGRAGDSALHLAALNGRDECVALLMPMADLGARNDRGMTPLHCASMNGHARCARLLLESAGAVLLDAVDRYGRTALHEAAQSGDAAIVDLLLGAGAAMPPASDGETPLHAAARKGRHEALARLLAAGADPSAREREGATPLHLAAESGSVECVDLLMGLADLHAIDGRGRSPHEAALARRRGAAASRIDARIRADDEARALAAISSRPLGRAKPARPL